MGGVWIFSGTTHSLSLASRVIKRDQPDQTLCENPQIGVDPAEWTVWLGGIEPVLSYTRERCYSRMLSLKCKLGGPTVKKKSPFLILHEILGSRDAQSNTRNA